MKLFPVCVMCAAAGFVRETAEIDHILSLAFGGWDVDENTQGLCLECHAAKTAAEDASRAGAANHPLWLKPSAIPTTIVCGPPAGGKSTFVEANRGPLDVALDLDELRAAVLGHPPGTRLRGTAGLDAAVRLRNSMLGRLATASTGRAFLVVGAPSAGERAWWREKLGPRASVVVCDPGRGEALRRNEARGLEYLRPAIVEWYRRTSMSWTPPAPKERRGAIGLDGAPEGWQ